MTDEFKDLLPEPSQKFKRSRIESESEDNQLPPEDILVKQKTQKKITYYDSNISGEEHEKVRMSLATTFFATGIPFRITDDEYFRKFLSDLRPGFTPPSRQTLATSMVDAVFKREKEKVITRLRQQRKLSIVTDGCTKMRPIFWKSLHTGDVAYSAAYMSDQIDAVIREVEEISGPKSVCGVVTDNAPNMANAWNILDGKYPHIFCNGCAAHTMNLLVKDILELDLFKQAVAKGAKRPGNETRRGLRLPVPAGVFSNKNIVRELFEDEEFINRFNRKPAKLKEVKEIIEDRHFFQDAKIVLDFIKPVNECLANFERDNASLSIVYESFNKILSLSIYRVPNDHVDNQIQRAVLDMILSRAIADFHGTDITDTINQAVHIVMSGGLNSGASEDEYREALVSFVTKKEEWATDPEKWNHQKQFSPLDWWNVTKTYAVLKDLALGVCFSCSNIICIQ
ncbi:hypothetical protein O9G_005963 [Rozella allomycis CSF55]|uniref:DUF659 domain-containing protein n=1 Tax=Rozella allomycis (strain CSF55) TaxID=988480 RepID=A0A075B282_ROZAC|nr:hypothetical protein O9G_005963 [Rozella allomycis CSF55]|eukprot:EPZ36680.1 hypothetical protein O9G_005963 [Rozella allomycis CSF55]